MGFATEGGWRREGPRRPVSFCPVVNARYVYVKVFFTDCVYLPCDNRVGVSNSRTYVRVRYTHVLGQTNCCT